jgi:hypothetical protein
MKHFSIKLSHEIPQQPKIVVDGRKPFIGWGSGNHYPQSISDLLHYSTIHNAIVNLKSNLTFGEGFLYPEDYVAPKANPIESLDDVLKKVAFDKVVFNGFALQIIWGRGAVGNRQIVEIHHLDVTTIRAGKPNSEGVVESYFVSADWTNERKNKPVEVAAFNPNNPEARQILFVFNYTPGLNYYPSPDYTGAINYINLDFEISKFHLNNIKNGLTPSLLINIPEIPSEDEREDIKREFEHQYRGSENAGKFLLTFSNGDELKPTVETISTNNNADVYNTLEGITTQKIITGHRLSSPVLAGLPGGASSLGSNAGEIVAANQYFLASVIQPYQKQIISSFEMLLSYTNTPVEGLEISNAQPIENVFSESLLSDILTTDELRAVIGYEALEEEQPEIQFERFNA